jgi:hypothetical protein
MLQGKLNTEGRSEVKGVGGHNGEDKYAGSFM